MWTKFYTIKKTEEYKNAAAVYSLLPINHKYKIEYLVGKEIYAALLFQYNVLSNIENYCDKFFDCDEHGFSYELGCYFQNREYQHEGFIQSDINKFSHLLKVYNAENFKKEYNLIIELVKDLKAFLNDWSKYEIAYPELFTSSI